MPETQEQELERLRAWHKARNSFIDHPAEDFTRWHAYERMPIQIHSQAVIMVTVFAEEGHLGDIWMHEHEDLMRTRFDSPDLYQRAAEQFRQQLQGHDCIAFWKALQSVAETRIREHAARAETIKAAQNEHVDNSAN